MHTPGNISNGNGSYGFLLCLISTMGAILISMDLSAFLQMSAWVFSIAASIMGVRHFYLTDKKIKNENKKGGTKKNPRT